MKSKIVFKNGSVIECDDSINAKDNSRGKSASFENIIFYEYEAIQEFDRLFYNCWKDKNLTFIQKILVHIHPKIVKIKRMLGFIR